MQEIFSAPPSAYKRIFICKRLKEHRQRLGLSLKFVAEATKIPTDQLSKYEYGECLVSPAELDQLATLYEVKPDYFLGEFELDR